MRATVDLNPRRAPGAGLMITDQHHQGSTDMTTTRTKPVRSDLLTQSAARAEAKRIAAEEGTITIATPVPPNSWGGEEDGWTVTTILDERFPVPGSKR